MDRVENLEELDLSDNEIPQIRGLSPLRHLKVLNLSTNLISTIEGLDILLRLEELDLSGNHIERIPASIKSLAALKILKLHNNKLSTLRDLVHIRPLKNLVSLTIFSNPMSEMEHSRSYAIYVLPTLSTLDDAPVDEEERLSSHTRFHREEVDLLEQQLAKARADIKTAKDEISKLENTNVGAKTSETRLGKDVNSLLKRIEQLETESMAKTDLLNKKSAELVGLCELLYEMKQELAFANIDKQFDMSAVDSIIGAGANDDSMNVTGFEDLDAQFEHLDANDELTSSGGGGGGGGGIYSPSLGYRGGSDTLSPLPFAHSGIAQEFREMPYIGKTSATPTRYLGGSQGGSRPGSRAPNGPLPSRKQLFESTAETQQAAYRYKTIRQQEGKLEFEKNAIVEVMNQEKKKLDDMRSVLEGKRKFVAENPDAPEAFTAHIEIETMIQHVSSQSSIVRQMENKLREVENRIEPLKIEAEQMKSLLGDLDDETIDSAYDLSMEVKALETQLEDRDETIEKMRILLEQKGLLSELDKVVVLRNLSNNVIDGYPSSSSSSSDQQSSSTIHTHSHSNHHTNSHTFSSEDVLAKLRAMEQSHLDRIKNLISGFPRYETESPFWDAQPGSIDEACHTLDQQITDAFGVSYSGFYRTASVASLRDRIKQLESHVEYLEHLKYTHFFNIEDGLDDDLDEMELLKDTAEKSGNSSHSTSSTTQANGSQEILFNLPKRVDSQKETTNGEQDSDEEAEEVEVDVPKGSGHSYGVRREKLGHSLLKQLWFLWRLIAMKMDTVRKAWEKGAISSSDMQAMTASGEWKYWSGMGRLEFFFQHAMSHISVLEHQVQELKNQQSSSLVTSLNSISNVEPLLLTERDSILSDITRVSEELEMKKVDVFSLRSEIEDLEKRKEEGVEISTSLDRTKAELSDIKSQREVNELELSHLKTQILQHRIKREEVESLQHEYDKLSRELADAQHAREEAVEARKEVTRIAVEIAGMQRLRDELDALKKEISNVKQESIPKKATTQQQQQASTTETTQISSLKPTVHSRSVSTTGTTSTTTTASNYKGNQTNINNTTSTTSPTRNPITRSVTAAASSPTTSSSTQKLTDSSVSATNTSSYVPNQVASTQTTTKVQSTPSASSVSSQTHTETQSLKTSLESIPVSTSNTSTGDDYHETPTLTPSSSANSLNASEKAVSVDSSITDRLSTYRQKELEARKLKEQEDLAKHKRAAPKRSWTVAETGGLARAGAGPENPRTAVIPSSSIAHLPSPVYSSPAPSPSPSFSQVDTVQETTKDAAVAQWQSDDSITPSSSSDDIRKDRRKSQLPKGLQDFLKMTGGPQ
jgi:hypothetical protein